MTKKFDSEGFAIHKGAITVAQSSSSDGYEFVRVFINPTIREYTKKAAEKVNKLYNDIDYTQLVGVVEPIFYGNDVVVEFQVYDKERSLYCAPTFNLKSTKIPLELLKTLDKIQVSKPEELVAELVKKGFILLKSETRTIKDSSGKFSLNRYQVRDHLAESKINKLEVVSA